MHLNSAFYLKNSPTAGATDIRFLFGNPTDIPLAGHWVAGSYASARPLLPPNILVTPTAAPVYVPGGNPGFENGPGMSFDGGSSAAGYTGGSTYGAGASGYTPGMAAVADTYPGLLHRRIYYTYDNLQRLTSAQYQDNNADTYNFAYGYDLNSNRIRSQQFFAPTNTILDATTYTYNEANQLKGALTSANVIPATIGQTMNDYNADGQLTTVRFVGETTPRRTMDYDSAGRLSRVTDNTTGKMLGYTYNGQNDLVFRSQMVNGVAQPAVSYLVDPTGELSQILAEFPASGPSTYYVPGMANTPLGQEVGGAQTWFARDGLGSVRALFDSARAQVRLTNFDPYGSPLETSGSVSTHLGYTGALTDDAGLVYLHARFYNPSMGQFLSGDPIEGKAADPRSWNRYGYVGGNPNNWTDPGGKCFILPLPVATIPGGTTNSECLDTSQFWQVFNLISPIYPFTPFSGLNSTITFSQKVQDFDGGGQIDETERELTDEERSIAEYLAKQGRKVKALKEVQGQKNADVLVDGVPSEFKSRTGSTGNSNWVVSKAQEAVRQADDVYLDMRGTSGLLDQDGDPIDEAQFEAEVRRRLNGLPHLQKLRKLRILLPDGKVIDWSPPNPI